MYGYQLSRGIVCLGEMRKGHIALGKLAAVYCTCRIAVYLWEVKMNTEASWIAVMVAGVVVLLAILSPGRTRGQLPRLEAIERPPMVYRVPLLGTIARRANALTWRLESIPVE